MVKRNLFLINCWLLFIVLAAFGKMAVVYQEWREAPPIVISFSSLENASHELSQISENFKQRDGSVKEQFIVAQRQTLEEQILQVEKNLTIKSKPVRLAKLTPISPKAKTIKSPKKVLVAKPQPRLETPVQKVVVVTTQKEVDSDLELFAINNEQPFEHGAVNAKQPEVFKTASLLKNLAPYKEKETVQAVAQAEVQAEEAQEPELDLAEAPVEPIAPREDKVVSSQAALQKVEVADDLTFFDYSEGGPQVEKTKAPQKELIAQPVKVAPASPVLNPVGGIPTTAKMSRTVEKAIARQLNAPEVKLEQDDEEEGETVAMNTQTAVTRTPYTSSPALSSRDAVNTQKSALQFAPPQKEEAVQESKESKEAKLALTAIQVDLNQGQGRALQNYEFEMGYDNSERLYDQGSGEVSWTLPLQSNTAVLEGRLVQKDSLRVRVGLSLSEGLLEMEVPTFSISSLEKFLSHEQLRGEGGFLLIDVQNEVHQTLLDAQFEKSFFLTENFTKTANAAEARYHLYIGVEPGNVLVTYQLKNKKTAQKVLFVGLDEMTFDPAEFQAERVRKLALYEQRLFGSELTDLQLDPKEIRFFNTNQTASAQGLNFYEINRPTLPLGMREYLELPSTREALFVGGVEAKSLAVPSVDFRDAVMDSHGLNDLNGSCLVQLNLTKKLKDLKVTAEAGPGPMNLTQSYLGRSGEFSSEFDETSTRAFFLGHEQGIINYRLDYLDGTSDSFQSFCSLGSYIVEQL